MLHPSTGLRSIDFRGRLGPGSYPSTLFFLSSPLQKQDIQTKTLKDTIIIFSILYHMKKCRTDTLCIKYSTFDVNISYCMVSNVIQRVNVKSVKSLRHVQYFGQIFILFSSISFIFQYSIYF